MPSDLRPSLQRFNEGRSQQPLLSPKVDRTGYSLSSRPILSRKSTFRGQDDGLLHEASVRKRYTYAAFFLVLSLIGFAVQTETAVYVQSHLEWNKPFCMLWMTHSSWMLIWPLQMVILKIHKWNQPWLVFCTRQYQTLRHTAQTVQHRTLDLSLKSQARSPWPYMIRTITFITTLLTVAGISWFIAVNLTTASDLTAIFNCSAFFAYAFSIPLLKDKLRASKVFAVLIAITGVLILAYGGKVSTKHDPDAVHAGRNSDLHRNYRSFGNLIVGIGSILYGLYEVLYKKVACPPDDADTMKSMTFATAVASMIGTFTFLVLWPLLPILNMIGWEEFELPHGDQIPVLMISIIASAIFSGSFLILISLTSPVLSSVAALLTIFVVALLDQLLPPPLHSPLSKTALIGGLFITFAFALLSWSTYKETDEQNRKGLFVDHLSESDVEDDQASGLCVVLYCGHVGTTTAFHSVRLALHLGGGRYMVDHNLGTDTFAGWFQYFNGHTPAARWATSLLNMLRQPDPCQAGIAHEMTRHEMQVLNNILGVAGSRSRHLLATSTISAKTRFDYTGLIHLNLER